MHDFMCFLELNQHSDHAAPLLTIPLQGIHTTASVFVCFHLKMAFQYWSMFTLMFHVGSRKDLCSHHATLNTFHTAFHAHWVCMRAEWNQVKIPSGNNLCCRLLFECFPPSHVGNCNVIKWTLWLHNSWYQRQQSSSSCCLCLVVSACYHPAMVAQYRLGTSGKNIVTQQSKSWGKSVQLCRYFQVLSVLSVHMSLQQLCL